MTTAEEVHQSRMRGRRAARAKAKREREKRDSIRRGLAPGTRKLKRKTTRKGPK